MAQDISGTNLAANAAKTVRIVAYKAEVQWDGVNWTDETANLKRIEWDNAFAPPEENVAEPGAGYAHEATVVLHNVDGRYSPYNPTSPLAAYIDQGAYYLKPIRLYVGFEGELLRIVTGYLVDISNPAQAGETLFMIRDRSATFIQEKATTPVYTNLRTDEWLDVLCDLVGIASGDRQFDAGMMIIPYIWLDDESVWEQMALAAAAEGGFLYFGWDGKLRFENGAHWAQHSVSQTTFTRSAMADLDPTHRPSEIYNEVVVEYSPRTLGPVQDIYTLERPVVIGPGQTHHLEARLQYPALPIYTPTADNDYIATLATGDAGTALLAVQNEVKYAQRYDADLVNSSANHILTVTKFRLLGNPLLGDPAGQVKVTRTSIIPHARTKDVRRNTLIQTVAQATTLAEFLADRFKNPRLILPLSGVPGLPWLELGDRITVQEPRLFTGSYANRDGFITRLTGRFAPEEPFQMDIMAISTPGLLQTTAYFIVGTSKWGTGTGYGELWYGGPVEASWTDVTDVATGDTLSAGYLNTLSANLNYVHGLLMGAEQANAWYFGTAGNPAGFIYRGMIWQQHRYLRWSLIVPGGTCTVKVNAVTVVTAGSTSSGVADLNSLGLTTGEFYSVTVEATADNTYVVELAEQADAAWPVTEPTFPTFSDGAVSAASGLNSLRDGLEWLYARARNAVLPHVGRFDSARPSTWTENEFPDNYRLAWRGTVRHRHNALKYRLRYDLWPYNYGKIQVRVRVDDGGAGEYFVTHQANTLWDEQTADGTVTLSGLSALALAKVEVWARHEMATTSQPVGEQGDEEVIIQGDDGSAFGPVFLYEDSGNGAIAGWVALPAFAHLDKPTAANLNKFKTDGDLLKAVARAANRPTPKLTDETLRAHQVHMRHTWRWLKYQTKYVGTEAQSVKLAWGENEVTLPDMDDGVWGTYDLEQIGWLVLGAIYRIENAVYVVETPTA